VRVPDQPALRDVRSHADPTFHAVSSAFEDSQVSVPQRDGIHTFVRTDN